MIVMCESMKQVVRDSGLVCAMYVVCQCHANPAIFLFNLFADGVS